LRELDVPFRANFPNPGRSLLTLGDETYPLPRGALSLARSRLLTLREKLRFIRLLTTLPRLDARQLDGVALGDWIEQSVRVGNVAAFLLALVRVSTYIDDPARLSAGVAIDQLRSALRGNVWYVDGGWQTLVNGLRARAVERGAEIRTGARVEAVQPEEGGVSVQLAGGDVLRGRAAILTVAPCAACKLLQLPDDAPLSRWTANAVPVKAACLDVALARLPRPRQRFALGLDGALYFSVHSAAARLAPAGTVVLHAMKYLGDSGQRPDETLESQVEDFVDRIQPGWRSCTITRRFLPGMTVAHSVPRADERGLAGRPAVTLNSHPNVFLAGDWVGSEGLLADAALASARVAAQRVLAALTRTRVERTGSLADVAS
jgi:phytoene dehydrogenase-like protein